MHQREKCHRHLWILSGTGEGPFLARELIDRGWNISVSVVSRQASLVYRDLPLEKLTIGPINGIEGIKSFLREAQISHNGFDLIVDATHPFALLISSQITEVCKELRQPLLRYERPVEDLGIANLIKSPEALSRFDLSGQRLLMAIGSRSLKEASMAAQKSGAKVFARILPMQESLRQALNTSISENHLALLHPRAVKDSGRIEIALCRKWSITGIVCRQSGGVTEKFWQKTAKSMNLDLWLLSRPIPSKEIDTVSTFGDIFAYLAIL